MIVPQYLLRSVIASLSLVPELAQRLVRIFFSEAQVEELDREIDQTFGLADEANDGIVLDGEWGWRCCSYSCLSSQLNGIVYMHTMQTLSLNLLLSSPHNIQR